MGSSSSSPRIPYLSDTHPPHAYCLYLRDMHTVARLSTALGTSSSASMDALRLWVALLGDREAVAVLLWADPAPLLDEVALHVAGEGERAAKSEGTKAQEVAAEARDGRLVGVLGALTRASAWDLGLQSMPRGLFRVH